MLEKGKAFTCEKQGGKTKCQQKKMLLSSSGLDEWTVRWKENCLNSRSQKVMVSV